MGYRRGTDEMDIRCGLVTLFVAMNSLATRNDTLREPQPHSVESVELVGYNRGEIDTRKDEERETW